MSNLVGNPEDRFSRNMVQIILFVSEKKSQLPELTPPMLNKLRHLTMVSLATKTKVYIHYSCIPMLNKLRHLTMVSLATKTKVYSSLLFQC